MPVNEGCVEKLCEVCGNKQLAQAACLFALTYTHVCEVRQPDVR